MGRRRGLGAPQVNFLFDRSTGPYVAQDALAGAFGLSKSTLGQKGKQIRDMLKITWGTPEFLRAEMIDANPMIWFVAGLLDAELDQARQRTEHVRRVPLLPQSDQLFPLGLANLIRLGRRR